MTTTPATDRLPSVGSVGLSRAVLELRQQLRQRDALIFTFMFPVVLLLTFGSIFRDEIPGTGVEFRQYFVAGMIATGVMAATFVNLGIGIALERDDGTLKRLRSTPMWVSSYFIGKAVMTLTVTCVQVILLLAIGVLFFDVALPATFERWLTFIWVLLLGTLACTLLGIVISAVPRSGRSAAGVVVLPFMVLQLISGVFFVFTQMATSVQVIGALFPLKWFGQGLRSVFLPEAMRHVEPTGMWEHDRIALVLAAWVIGGLVLSVATFRWHRSGV